MSGQARSTSGVLMQELRGIAEVARKALEPGLEQDTNGRPVSAGSCLYACLLLASMLLQFTQLRVGLRGGSGLEGQGALGLDGLWHGHFWLVVVGLTEVDGEVVVDITSDQFGYEQVTVLRSREGRDRYAPGDQGEVDAQGRLVLGSLPMDGYAIEDGWLVRTTG
jgi:hypothetical protein